MSESLQKLVEKWRAEAATWEFPAMRGMLKMCADELESVLRALGEQEPVAWRAWHKDEWVYWDEEPTTIQDDPEFTQFQAFYAHPIGEPKSAEVEARVWLVWSNEHNAWWRANANGYCTTIEGAGRYTLAEAREHADSGRSARLDGLPNEVVTPAPEFQERQHVQAREGLQEFVRDLFDAADWPEGGDIDAFAFQELAEEYGILIRTKMDKPCREEGCSCAENGADFPTECLRKVPWLLASPPLKEQK